MEYIIERNSSTPGFEIENDSKAAGIRQYVNYHKVEEGYKLHSVVPFDNGDHLVVLEPDLEKHYSVYYHEAGSGRLLLEFTTTDILEQIKLVKETDSILIETESSLLECTYVKSRIHVYDNGSEITDALDVFFEIISEE